jgi:hypothetical protein
MQIIITWSETSQYPRFDVELASTPTSDPFIKIRGCGLMKKKSDNSEFVSWPSTKNQTTGKYWNHVYGSDAFNAAVLAEAKKTQPAAVPARSAAAPAADPFDGEIPF